jgi:hypothetical protein
MQPAPPGPYKAVSVTLPPRETDASLDAFRKELGDIAKKKDRAALQARGSEGLLLAAGRTATMPAPRKSGIDNLAAAVGLDEPDGWAGRRYRTMPPMPLPRHREGRGLQPGNAELQRRADGKRGTKHAHRPSRMSVPDHQRSRGPGKTRDARRGP